MPAGRPTVMTEETIKQLEVAYSNDASDGQACFLANISKQSLYNYQEQHPEFIDRKKALKNSIKYQAKLKIREAILKEDKPDTSKWYLERKDRDFKPKQDITTDDKPLNENVLDKVLETYAYNLQGENSSNTGTV